MVLYSYYRSSAAYRVRIALNLKQIEHTIKPINLLKKEHKSTEYLAKQPQGLVPCLETNDGRFLAQSGAILTYLDTMYTSSTLLPPDPFQAARIQSFVDMIACEIHPICNLRILNYLTEDLTLHTEQKLVWYHHWIKVGFEVLESMLEKTKYSFGDQITLADIYLAPQVYNAIRFEVDMTSFPKLINAYHNCNKIEAFIQAQPANQLDTI
jgi:maleylpyruvate isomerase